MNNTHIKTRDINTEKMSTTLAQKKEIINTLTLNNTKMNKSSSFYIINNSKCIFINNKLSSISLIKSIQELNFAKCV